MKVQIFLSFLFLSFFNLNSQNIDWAFSGGGNSDDAIRDFVTDDQGNIISVGYFQNTIDFDSGVGVNEVITHGKLLYLH